MLRRCVLAAKIWLLAAGLILLTSSAFAQTPQLPAAAPAAQSAARAPATSPTATPQNNPRVEVTSKGNQVGVKVPDQAPLSTVVSAVCQQQKIKCSGTETLASYRGPAMSVEGTLRQVIGKLLEGTDVNYEFSRTEAGGATAIAFLGHAPHGTAAVPSPDTSPMPDRPPLLHSHPFPSKPPANAPPQSEVRPADPVPAEAPTQAASAGQS